MAADLFVVVNPQAGNGRGAAVWSEARARLAAMGLSYEFEATQGSLTAESFVRQALRRGFESIVVVGGDGTFNEAVNGFFLDGEPVGPGARLALVPSGSSNDAARGLAIPEGSSALSLLSHGKVAQLDVGKASFLRNGQPTDRLFINQADVGIGGRIARGADRFKRIGGTAAFMLSSVMALATPSSWSGRLQLDDRDPSPVQATSIALALGPYSGGGMAVAPDAKWDDGVFDVVIIDAMDRAELLGNFPRIYAGTHLSHPKVHLEHAQRVVIQTMDSPPMELDGEVDQVGNIEFNVLPGMLPILVSRP